MYPSEILVDKGKIPGPLFARLVDWQSRHPASLQAEILLSLWIAPLQQRRLPQWTSLYNLISPLSTEAEITNYFEQVYRQVEDSKKLQTTISSLLPQLGQIHKLNEISRKLWPEDLAQSAFEQTRIKLNDQDFVCYKNGNVFIDRKSKKNEKRDLKRTIPKKENYIPQQWFELFTDLVYYHYMTVLRHQSYLHFQISAKLKKNHAIQVHLGPLQIDALVETVEICRLFVPFGALGICGQNFEIPYLLQMVLEKRGSAKIYKRRQNHYLLLDIPVKN